jgi:hypothetical protein
MGQSGGERPHGTGGAAAGQRLVQPAGEGALLQRQRQPALAIGERRDIDGDEAVSERRRIDRHLAVGDAGPLGAGLVQQGEQRTIRGKDVLEQAPQGRHAQELGRRRIDEADPVLGVQGQHRQRQGLQQLIAIDAARQARRRRKDQRRGGGGHQAASLSTSGR